MSRLIVQDKDGKIVQEMIDGVITFQAEPPQLQTRLTSAKQRMSNQERAACESHIRELEGWLGA